MLKFRQFSYYHRYLQCLHKSHTLIAGNKYWKLVIWLLIYVIVFICAGCNGIFLYCPCCPIVKLLFESNNTLSAPKGDIFTYIILKTHIVLKVWFFEVKPFLCDQCENSFALHSSHWWDFFCCFMFKFVNCGHLKVKLLFIYIYIYIYISTSICYSQIFSNIFMSFILKASFW
jgi:hypothetical protein